MDTGRVDLPTVVVSGDPLQKPRCANGRMATDGRAGIQIDTRSPRGASSSGTSGSGAGGRPSGVGGRTIFS
jgi:hypothetical protein